MNLPKNPI